MKEKKICMNCENAGEALLAYLRSHLEHHSEFYNLISPLFQARKLSKNEMIANEGEVCSDAFWLHSGYGRYFKITVDEEGFIREETIDFCKSGTIVFIDDGFFNESTSHCNFQLAAGAVIIPFTKHCFEYLKMKGPEALTLANKILALKAYRTKGINVVKMKSREKYAEFLRFFGAEIEQCFAVKDIASYLGMQPSYLSRLRGEFLRKKNGLIKYLQTVFIVLYLI